MPTTAAMLKSDHDQHMCHQCAPHIRPIFHEIHRHHLHDPQSKYLAKVLASVPMMRPRLSRAAATPYGSSQRSLKADLKAKSHRRVSEKCFERLKYDAAICRWIYNIVLTFQHCARPSMGRQARMIWIRSMRAVRVAESDVHM